MPNFIIVAYVWQLLGREPFCPTPHLWAAPKKPILSRVKVDVSNYATKSDFKNLTHVDTSNFALKTNLAGLKTEVDKLDIDKLVVKNSLFLLI